VKLFLRQFSAELLKLFTRKRTWIGFGAFLGLEALVLMLSQTEKAKRGFRAFLESNGAMFEEYFGGLTLAFNMMALTVALLGAIFVALVAGDIVSKEVEDGTMRMTLCRPVSRVRVLGVKFLASLLYCFVLIVFIGVTALLTGLAWQGLGSLCAVIPEEKLLAFYPPGEGLARYFAALPCFGLSFCTIVSLAFMFSCCNMKPASATIVSLAILFVDRILDFWPQFASFKPWFMTSHMVTWLNVFRSPLPWGRMAEDYLYLFGLDATFVLVGFTIFLRRDLKS
jgi:ABC-2 type transport system permease protein